MTTEVEQSKLNIHVLNQTQYEELPSVSDTELYIVDPQFQGGKLLATSGNGDIIESDISVNILGDIESALHTINSGS